MVAICLVPVLGGRVSRWLAAQAKDALLEPLDAALVHSPVEAPFVARGDRKLFPADQSDRILHLLNVRAQAVAR